MGVEIIQKKRCINCVIKQCSICKKKQEVKLFKRGSAKCNKCLYAIRKEYLKEYVLKNSTELAKKKKIKNKEKAELIRIQKEMEIEKKHNKRKEFKFDGKITIFAYY